jgi:DNA modification methylase
MALTERAEWHPDMPDEFKNQIVTGDARELAKAIPDESIDLIFTDPIYDRVDDYRWLAETASRVLKPDRACLVWCSNVKQYEVKTLMGEYLDFVLPFQYVVIGKTYRLMYYHAFIWTTPCLWFQKGRVLPKRWIPDTFISMQPTSKQNGHRWNKNEEAYLQWLDAFTNLGNIIWDPYTGGATVPACCKKIGLNFLASEIDPATAEHARERVRNTQPPLFVLEPEQMEMGLE